MPEVFPGVSVDQTHSFGRPRLTDLGIPTAALAGCFAAGDSIDAIARDYEIERAKVEQAIRWEMLDRRKKKRLIEKAGA